MYKFFSFRSMLLTFACLIMLHSCKNADSNLAAFKALDKSLQASNETINNDISQIKYSFQQKLEDPGTVAKARTYEHKVSQVSRYCEALTKYLDSLKDAVKREAAIKTSEGAVSLDESDVTVGEKVFTKMGKGPELNDKLEKFKRALLSIDTFMNGELPKEILAIDWEDSLMRKAGESFHDIPTVAVLASLTGLQNQTIILQQKLLQYYHNNITFHDTYRSTSFIIGINSRYVKKGDKIEVFSGVGAFSLEVKPEVSINGIPIPVGTDGVAVYSFNAPSTPGRHYLNATINYTDYDGEKKSVSKRIEYTVIK